MFHFAASARRVTRLTRRQMPRGQSAPLVVKGASKGRSFSGRPRCDRLQRPRGRARRPPENPPITSSSPYPPVSPPPSRAPSGVRGTASFRPCFALSTVPRSRSRPAAPRARWQLLEGLAKCAATVGSTASRLDARPLSDTITPSAAGLPCHAIDPRGGKRLQRTGGY
jgi:hypothetical protein